MLFPMTVSSPLSPRNQETEAASITDGLHILAYVKGPAGGIEPVAQPGWQPVNEVNRQAWEEIERRIEAARGWVRTGRRSCLYYYMVANQMDPLLLARYSGQSPLLVWLHLRPFFFRRIDRKRLCRYADLFQVEPEALVRGDLHPPVYQLHRA